MRKSGVRIPYRSPILAINGSLAQLVERRFYTPNVAGSSPAGPTISMLTRPKRPWAGLLLPYNEKPIEWCAHTVRHDLKKP